MEKGIFTLEQEKKLASLLDELVKLKGMPEFLDGYLFKSIITLVDDTLLEKLPEDIKVKLSAVIDAVMVNNVELAETLSANLLSELINIPGLDKTSESLILKAMIEIIMAAVMKWVETKKIFPVTPAPVTPKPVTPVLPVTPKPVTPV